MSAADRPVPADARHFDAKFREDADPWDYRSSAYEQEKRARTVEACGPDGLGAVLELGAATGVLSAELAPRCARLTTIDFSPTAVAIARERLSGSAHVKILEGSVPDDLPADGRYDVVVASEILYYLPDAAFDRALRLLPELLTDGGRLVAVHWTGRADDLARSAAATHDALRSTGLRAVPLPAADHERGYLLDAFER
ncbi:unannotated protein [freshwater metagenome]|uniref:Unannotated protein n=1 Tax=freshwater metagenome TaxID=449393 RepID=A0A6J7FQ10_9ZZZZ|nr:methyltransferase domain-containing protein [Actinomycetota bacterium]